MNEQISKLTGLFEKGARWLVRRRVGGEAEVREMIDGAGPTPERGVVQEVAREAAKRTAIRAFVTGLASSPWAAIPLAFVDLRGATTAEARVAAVAGYVHDPAFFEYADWDRRVLLAMLGVDPKRDAYPEAIAKRLALSQARRYALRTATNTLPIGGAFISAVVEHTLLEHRARRLERYFSSGIGAPSTGAEPVGREGTISGEMPQLERHDREPEIAESPGAAS